MVWACSRLPERSAVDITENFLPPASRSWPTRAASSVLVYFWAGVTWGVGVGAGAELAAVAEPDAVAELDAVAAEPVPGSDVLAGPLQADSPATRSAEVPKTRRADANILPPNERLCVPAGAR